MKCSTVQSKKLGMLLVVAVLMVGAAHAAQPTADVTTSGPGYEVTREMQRYREMGEVMGRMQAEMKAMSDKLRQPSLEPQQYSSIAPQMKRMSSMMQRMSGLIDRPSMRDADARKELSAMRKEMDAMRQHDTGLGRANYPAPQQGTSRTDNHRALAHY